MLLACNSVIQSPAVPECRKATTLSKATVAHRRGGVIQGATMEIPGQVLGRWELIEYIPATKGRRDKWVCRCKCGTIRRVVGNNLRRGISKSCGCLRSDTTKSRSITHGHTVDGKWSGAYRSWSNMLTRCFNKNFKWFHRYGGRGITVCQEWQEFSVFLSDMGERPPKTTLGRIDNNGNYCKSNCRWETNSQQANNKRNSQFLTVNGIKKTISQWAAGLGTGYHTIENRVKRGWTPERAVTIPVKQ